jgi:hypothetical protein
MKPLTKFFTRLWLWLFPGSRLRLREVADAPDAPALRVMYVMGACGHKWHLIMRCPCGCGASIYLNLLPDDRPLWKLEIHEDGTFSLSPSVWRTTGCRSHFFVRRSRIEWCGVRRDEKTKTQIQLTE